MKAKGILAAGLLLIAGLFIPALEEHKLIWLEWEELETPFPREKGYVRSHGSLFEASRSGKWLAQVWEGVQIVEGEPPDERYAGPVEGTRLIDRRCVVIWEVGADGRLLRPVWSSEDKDFHAVNWEWIKDDLLLAVLPGIRDVEEAGLEDGPPLQVLAVQPETGRVQRFTNLTAHIISAHPKGDRVLLGRTYWYGDRGEQRFWIYTYPEGEEIASFRFNGEDVIRNDRWYLDTDDTLLGWGDSENIWALVKRKGPRIPATGFIPLPVPVLVSIDMQGKVKMLSGNPKRNWVQVPWLLILSLRELSCYTFFPQVLDDGRVAVMMGKEPRLVLYSGKDAPKKYRFEPDKYPKMLKEVLQKLVKIDQGVKILAITLDGKRLILQEGVYGPTLDLRQQFGVWLWDLESNQMEKIGELRYIKEVFGWLGKEYLIVGVYADSKTRLRYGVMHIPRVDK